MDSFERYFIEYFLEGITVENILTFFKPVVFFIKFVHGWWSHFSRSNTTLSCARNSYAIISSAQAKIISLIIQWNIKHTKMAQELKHVRDQILKHKSRLCSAEELIKTKALFVKSFNSYEAEVYRETISTLDAIINLSQKHLFRHYNSTKGACRVCLKVIAKNNQRLTKISKCKFNNNDSLLEDNEQSIENNGDTGVLHAKKRADYYICNDIPYEFSQKNYQNSRLKAYKDVFYSKPYFWDRWKLNRNWKNMAWKNTEQRDEAYYKSTLIIPLTLKDYPDTDALSDLWQFISSKLQFMTCGSDKTHEKGPFGYLCLDSTQKNYFDVPKGNAYDSFRKSVFLNHGYFVADLLSLVLFIFFNYTDFSECYAESKVMAEEFKNELEVFYERETSGN